MPPVAIFPVQEGGVSSDTVIPNDDSAGSPFNPGLDVGTQSKVIEEKLQQVVRLLSLVAYDATGELRVNVDGLFARCWVGSHKRMAV